MSFLQLRAGFVRLLLVAFCSSGLYGVAFLTPSMAAAQADPLSVPGEAPIEAAPGKRRETPTNARHLAPTYPSSSRLDLPPFSLDEETRIRALVANKRRHYTGFGRELSLAAQNWFLVERRDGFDVWQAHVYSPSALRVTAHFSGFGLGEEAFVNVYSLDSQDEYMGTYNGRGPEGNGRFISNIVLGDTIIFEFWSPTQSDLAPAGFPFSIDSITHTFRDKDGRLHGLSSVGERRPVEHVADNSSCPVNVSRCADYGMAVGSAVARYIVTAPGGEQVLCTGALLSSAAANSRRLFMTAWHCVEDTVVDSEAGSIPVNAMFTFGDDTCDSQTASPPEAPGLSRATGGGTGLCCGWIRRRPGILRRALWGLSAIAWPLGAAYGVFTTRPVKISSVITKVSLLLIVSWRILR